MLARHLAGESRAFAELVDRFGSSVYGYLSRAGLRPPASEDLFQETFMRVHVSAGRYDPAHPFSVWLLTICNNLIRSHFRKQRVRRVLTGWWRRRRGREGPAELEPLDPPDGSPDAERLASARQSVRWLEEAMDRLPANQRQALSLTRLQGLSQQEAARVLDVPVATIKTWVRRARLTLADGLSRLEGER